MGGGKSVVIEPHRHEGIFIARGKEDALVTKNMCPGEAVYGEKRISVEKGEEGKMEYRVWNPFRLVVSDSVLTSTFNVDPHFLDQSWLLVSWVASILSTCPRVARSCTSELPLEPPSRTSPTWSDL